MKIELISSSIGRNSYENINNEEIIAAIARHGNIKNDNGKLVTYLMDQKHYSPLQHIFFGFKIQTSRAISAQIFRHRSLNFQERSQRYEKILSFEDIELRAEHPTNRQSSLEVINNHQYYDAKVQTLLNDVNNLYNELVDNGVAKECARAILPMASSTVIHVSGTLRDLLAFLNIRTEKHSQKECQEIATGMGVLLEEELPNIFKKIDWRNGLFM